MAKTLTFLEYVSQKEYCATRKRRFVKMPVFQVPCQLA